MISVAVALANARLQATADFLDLGAGKARLQVWSGARPSSGATPSGVKLSEIMLSKPCGAVVAGVLTIVTPKSDFALAADGSVVWARLINGAGAFALDGDCTVTGGGGDFEFNRLAVYAGGTLTLTSAALA